MIFYTTSSELLFLSSWNCAEGASVVRGDEETGAKDGGEARDSES